MKAPAWLFVQLCRLAGFLLLGASLLPEWGMAFYRSSLHANDTFSFDGLMVLRWLPFSFFCGFLDPVAGLLLIVLAAGAVVMVRQIARRGGLAGISGVDRVLLGVGAGLVVLWLFVLVMHLIGGRIPGFAASIRFIELLPGFWLVPLVVLLAGAVRLLPRLLVRRR